MLAPHGSLCVELGDTYAGSGGSGGDYNPGGIREGQGKSDGSSKRSRSGWHRSGNESPERYRSGGGGYDQANYGNGWPLAKSLTGTPTLYTWSLAYGRNLLTGQPSPAGQWRIRNVIVWARPNPPVGALGDKFRPATSYITVACKSAKRYFDLDGVRTVSAYQDDPRHLRPDHKLNGRDDGLRNAGPNPAGAPPLDWHADDHPEDGDWLWKMATQPYKGAHYAAFSEALPKKLIEAMCPRRVCRECGKPSERVVEQTDTTGWTDCGHDNYRTGVVLDPFGGSGTTGAVALGIGRDCILIDVDERNVHLARERIGMFLEVDDGRFVAAVVADELLNKGMR